MAHGAQKLCFLFGGRGLTATARWMEVRGYRPGIVFALLAGMSLIVGGAGIALGLGGPIGPACVMCAMVVAASITASAGFFAQNQGAESALTYAALAALFAYAGYGRFSLDAVFGLAARWPQWEPTAALAAALGVGMLVVAVRGPSGPRVDSADERAGAEPEQTTAAPSHDGARSATLTKVDQV